MRRERHRSYFSCIVAAVSLRDRLPEEVALQAKGAKFAALEREHRNEASNAPAALPIYSSR